MIIPLTNKSKNFYSYLGSVFGSREVEKITGDRFYDDDDKVWYVYFKRSKPVAFVSIVDDVIKNVWSDSRELLVKTLEEVNKKHEIKESVVPAIFRDEYVKAGFSIVENGYKKFIKIKGGASDNDQD